MKKTIISKIVRCSLFVLFISAHHNARGMNMSATPDLQIYWCNKCTASFNRLSRLEAHKKTHRKKAKKMFSCKSCNKSFQSTNYLIQHNQKFHVTPTIDIQYLTHLELYFGTNDCIDSFKKDCIKNLGLYSCLTKNPIKKNPDNIKSFQGHKSLHDRLTHHLIQEFPIMIHQEIPNNELITIL